MQPKAKNFSLEEWANTKPELFDCTEEFNSTISPIMSALLAECHRLQLPVLVSVGYKQDGVATGYAAQSYFPSAQRSPVALLYTNFAMHYDLDSMQSVLNANSIRVMMSAITKH
jgi:hypothetical protein